MRTVRRLASLAVAALVLTACSSTASQDSLRPAGPNAESIHDLFIPVLWIAAIIFVVVEVALVAFADRKSTRLNSSHVSESRMPSSA